MKTLCAFDNVACIVDNFPASLDSVTLPIVAIGFALGIALVLASVVKGL